MNDSERLYQLRALVTGGASGIGEAIVRVFAKHGAEVLTVDLPETAIETQFDGVSGVTGRVQDITDDDAPDNLLALVKSELGGLDILVNNAGIAGMANVEDMDDELWDSIMAVNVRAMFRLSRAAIPLLKKSPAGRIINIGSVLSERGPAGLAAYVASKHAVAGLTKSLASEVGEFGITANCIEPGAIMTAMTRERFRAHPEVRDYWIRRSAAGRLGEPLDIARVALFLASDDAGFVSGTGIVADGGTIQAP